jgi:transcription factor IIIB subunit 2
VTTGRATKIVAAACLYMACRIKKSPHLLIDFADAIQVDMFRIAKAFKVISNAIYLPTPIPLIDPSLFIESFCAKLEFGDKMR